MESIALTVLTTLILANGINLLFFFDFYEPNTKSIITTYSLMSISVIIIFFISPYLPEEVRKPTIKPLKIEVVNIENTDKNIEEIKKILKNSNYTNVEKITELEKRLSKIEQTIER